MLFRSLGEEPVRDRVAEALGQEDDLDPIFKEINEAVKAGKVKESEEERHEKEMKKLDRQIALEQRKNTLNDLLAKNKKHAKKQALDKKRIEAAKKKEVRQRRRNIQNQASRNRARERMGNAAYRAKEAATRKKNRAAAKAKKAAAETTDDEKTEEDEDTLSSESDLDPEASD